MEPCRLHDATGRMLCPSPHVRVRVSLSMKPMTDAEMILRSQLL